jgi:hypothetical protein
MKHKKKIIIGTGIIAFSAVLIAINVNYLPTRQGSLVSVENEGINMSKHPQAKHVTQEKDGHITLSP